MKKGAEAPFFPCTACIRRCANLAAPQAPRPRRPKGAVLGAEGPVLSRAAGAASCVSGGGAHAVNELPQPQLPVAFGLLNAKPAPIMVVT